jgi:diguanylate cyclase (GGDEF)-like protein/PAS domain S-box-containing protein
MAHIPNPETQIASATGNWLDRLLHAFSLRVVPLILVLFSFIVVIGGMSYYDPSEPPLVSAQYLEDRGGTLDVASAEQALTLQPAQPYRDTHLSEAPFWFRFTVKPMTVRQATVVEFPSRHARELACWDATTLAPFGSAAWAAPDATIDQHSADDHSLMRVKSGFALRLGRVAEPQSIVCRGTFSGPARIAVRSWPAPAFQRSIGVFHRDVGLLEGGMLMLAAFVLVTALINRESMYVIFAIWLVGNLRLGALSIGSDNQWLGHTIPMSALPLVRQVTIGLYFIITCTLLGQLFRNDLPMVRGHRQVMGIVQVLGFVLLGAALVFPYRTFLPVMWAIASIGIAGLIYMLVPVIVKTRSRVAVWYGASLGVTLFASFSEVIAAAFGVKTLIGALNSVTAALLSSLMAALAVAEQIRIERSQRAMIQAQFRETYDTTPIGLFTLDEDGVIVRGNPALQRILNASALTRRTFLPAYFEPDGWEKLRAIAHRSTGEEIELRSAPRAGEPTKWFLVKATLTRGQIEGSLQDITERVRANERLHFLAENDALTGSLNRRGLEKIIARSMSSPTTRGDFVPFSLAYLDLDRFKLINDLFGHRAGDEVLRQVSDRIRHAIGDEHALGRMGGDEFVLVIHDPNIQRASALCREIVVQIAAKPYQIGRRAFQVRGSIGVLEVSERMGISDAISAADRACREAKDRTDRLCVYGRDSGALAERAEALKLIERLEEGFETTGLYLEMQPIMSLRTPDEALDFEVLLRMRDANGTIVPPTKVIAAAEENGNISELDKWVLTTTLRWLEANEARLPNTRFVCVNLSGASLNDEHFIDEIFTVLEAHPDAVRKLCVEITEGVALHDLDNTRRFINRLQLLGGKIALDDFGAGYTSFSYLKDLPADALKIDGAFIRSMAQHPANAAIVEAIVALARNLGMRSIAEWVEDCDTLRSLASLGVDYVQGWAISRPQPPEAILASRSAAEFITDEKVRAFARFCGEHQIDEPVYSQGAAGWH